MLLCSQAIVVFFDGKTLQREGEHNVCTSHRSTSLHKHLQANTLPQSAVVFLMLLCACMSEMRCETGCLRGECVACVCVCVVVSVCIVSCVVLCVFPLTHMQTRNHKRVPFPAHSQPTMSLAFEYVDAQFYCLHASHLKHKLAVHPHRRCCMASLRLWAP